MSDPGRSTAGANEPVSVVERNITALIERRAREEKALGWQDRLAGAIGTFAGSMTFVWVHLLAYGAWVLINTGVVPVVSPFDPTFVILAMIASVEAIFISTFILIMQNRMQAQADRRAELHLQISLLAEHELTRIMDIVSSIAERLGEPPDHPDLPELKREIHPEQVLDSLKRHIGSER